MRKEQEQSRDTELFRKNGGIKSAYVLILNYKFEIVIYTKIGIAFLVNFSTVEFLHTNVE